MTFKSMVSKTLFKPPQNKFKHNHQLNTILLFQMQEARAEIQAALDSTLEIKGVFVKISLRTLHIILRVNPSPKFIEKNFFFHTESIQDLLSRPTSRLNTIKFFKRAANHSTNLSTFYSFIHTMYQYSQSYGFKFLLCEVSYRVMQTLIKRDIDTHVTPQFYESIQDSIIELKETIEMQKNKIKILEYNLSQEKKKQINVVNPRIVIIEEDGLTYTTRAPT